MANIKRETRWFLGYGIIGVTGIAIYLVIVWLLDRAGAQPLIATVAGYLCGATFQFVFNRQWNFRAVDQPVARQAFVYSLVMGLNFLSTIAGVALGVYILHMTTFMATLVVLPIVAPLAYLANRFLTFKPSQR